MNWFTQLCSNQILVNAFCAWAAAQILKTIIFAVTNKTFDIHRLLGAGGMPSSHAATVVAMTVTAGMVYGLDSPIFAITAVILFIVIHDAVGVRMEAGKHAKLLNYLMDTVSGAPLTEKRLKELLGHTPLQVFFGSLLGILVAVGLCSL